MQSEKLRALLALRLSRQLLPPPLGFKLSAEELNQPLMARTYAQLPFQLRAELRTELRAELAGGFSTKLQDDTAAFKDLQQLSVEQACDFAYQSAEQLVYVIQRFHDDQTALKRLFDSQNFRSSALKMFNISLQRQIELLTQLPVPAIQKAAFLSFELSVAAHYVLSGGRLAYQAAARAPRLKNCGILHNNAAGSGGGGKDQKDVCMEAALPGSAREIDYSAGTDEDQAAFNQLNRAPQFVNSGNSKLLPEPACNQASKQNNAFNSAGANQYINSLAQEQQLPDTGAESANFRAETPNQDIITAEQPHNADFHLPPLPRMQDLINYLAGSYISNQRQQQLAEALAHCWYWRARFICSESANSAGEEESQPATALEAALENAGRAGARFQFTLLYFAAGQNIKNAARVDNSIARQAARWTSLIRCDLSDFAAAVSHFSVQNELLSFIQVEPIAVLIKSRVFELAAQVIFSPRTAGKLLNSLSVLYCDLQAAEGRNTWSIFSDIQEKDADCNAGNDSQLPDFAQNFTNIGSQRESAGNGQQSRILAAGQADFSFQPPNQARSQDDYEKGATSSNQHNNGNYNPASQPTGQVERLYLHLLQQLDMAPVVVDVTFPAHASFAQLIYQSNSDDTKQESKDTLNLQPSADQNGFNSTRAPLEVRATEAYLAYRNTIQAQIDDFQRVCAVKDMVATSLPVVSQSLSQGFETIEESEWQQFFDIALQYVNLTNLPLPQGPQAYKNRYQNAFVERDLNAQESTFQQIQRLFLNPEVIQKNGHHIISISQADADDLERVAPLTQQATILLNGCETTARLAAGLAGSEELKFLVRNYLAILSKGVLLSSDEQAAFACAVFLHSGDADCRRALEQILPFLRPDLQSFLESGLKNGVKEQFVKDYAADPELFVQLRAVLDFERPELYFGDGKGEK